MNKKSNDQVGQTLLELMVVIAVGILVVGALVFATISSLRNAYFAKNQIQAVKLSQEGMERVRGVRDQDGGVLFQYRGGQTQKFSDLWTVRLRDSCEPCYFNLDKLQKNLSSVSTANFEDLGSGFGRQVILSDTNSGDEKKVDVIVYWSDFAGSHQSKLSTILRKL